MCEDGHVVQAIRARKVRGGRNVAITFEVCPDTWRRFVREERYFGTFFGTLDYLEGELNRALSEREPMSMGDPNWEPPPLTPEEIEASAREAEEFMKGRPDLKPPRKDDDDDIPF